MVDHSHISPRPNSNRKSGGVDSSNIGNNCSLTNISYTLNSQGQAHNRNQDRGQHFFQLSQTG